jgi:ribosomal protein S18 acetylase RimI-like enzyme
VTQAHGTKMHTMAPISIRRAGPPDAVAVAACVTAAYGHYVERIGGLPGPMLDDYAEVVAQHEVHLAQLEGKIVGIVVLRRAEEGFLLDNVAVHPAYQGCGIGRQLLELAETRARQEGFDSLYLYTHIKMIENRALYERIGYREYAQRTEDGLTRVFMRKQLVP